MTAAIERLREFWEKAQCGPIVGFRTRFRSSDDQDQTLVNAAGEELAVTYSENTARVIAAAMNALPALLECASALEAFASDNFVSGSQMVEAVKKARAALDALAAQGETKT